VWSHDTVVPRPDRDAGGMVKFKTLAGLALSAVLVFGVVACSVIHKPKASPSASAGSDQEQALKFAQCMRDHGVDVADPGGDTTETGGSGGSPGTLNIGGGSDLSVGGAAFDACRHFLPNGGEAHMPDAAELAQMVKYARCMRAHGIDYPDPNPDGSISFSSAGPFQFDDPTASARLDAASRACESLMSPAPAK